MPPEDGQLVPREQSETGDMGVMNTFIIGFATLVCCVLVSSVIYGVLYNCFWRRFDWLASMKSWTGEPRYVDWPDIVPQLESGNGTLLHVQGRHCWMLHWHSQKLSKNMAVEERVEDADCFFTAQPIGYETTISLRRRFPKVPVFCIYVDYRGSFG